MRHEDIYEERTIAQEDRALAYYEKRLEHLDNELEVRSKLSFAKTEPVFEYENDPEYMEHLKRGLALTVDYEKLQIQTEIEKILNARDTRAAIKAEREGKNE